MTDEQQTLDQRTPEQPTGTVEDLITRVQELGKRLATARDQVLRIVADLQNVRRRAGQDVEKAYKFTLERFVGDPLVVADTLERGLEMSDPNDRAIKSIREGMELTLKMFDDTLRRYQMEALSPEGESFNPEQHRMMAMQESASAEPGSVLKTFRKGYLLNDHLLRPVIVVVSKVPAEAPPSTDKQT